MRRREFIALIGGAATGWPLATRAQRRPTNIPRIGIIDDAPIWDHFRQGLSELGYVEGRDVVIEYRSGQGQPDRLAAAASELAKLRVDVIVTSGSAATQAAKQATTTIPIVMIAVGDPVRAGLVASLARPDANVSGNTILGTEMAAKRVQLLKEFIPAFRVWPFYGIRTTPPILPILMSGALLHRPWASSQCSSRWVIPLSSNLPLTI